MRGRAGACLSRVTFEYKCTMMASAKNSCTGLLPRLPLLGSKTGARRALSGRKSGASCRSSTIELQTTQTHGNCSKFLGNHFSCSHGHALPTGGQAAFSRRECLASPRSGGATRRTISLRNRRRRIAQWQCACNATSANACVRWGKLATCESGGFNFN